MQSQDLHLYGTNAGIQSQQTPSIWSHTFVTSTISRTIVRGALGPQCVPSERCMHSGFGDVQVLVANWCCHHIPILGETLNHCSSADPSPVAISWCNLKYVQTPILHLKRLWQQKVCSMMDVQFSLGCEMHHPQQCWMANDFPTPNERFQPWGAISACVCGYHATNILDLCLGMHPVWVRDPSFP